MPFCDLNTPAIDSLWAKRRNLNIGKPQKAETYSMDSHTNRGLSKGSAREHKEEKIFRSDEREKYANILNPSNSETSKKRTKRQKLTVSHWSKKRLLVRFLHENFIKYVSSFYRSTSFSAKKTQTHMGLDIIFELKVLGENHQRRWNI